MADIIRIWSDSNDGKGSGLAADFLWNNQPPDFMPVNPQLSFVQIGEDDFLDLDFQGDFKACSLVFADRSPAFYYNNMIYGLYIADNGVYRGAYWYKINPNDLTDYQMTGIEYKPPYLNVNEKIIMFHTVDSDGKGFVVELSDGTTTRYGYVLTNGDPRPERHQFIDITNIVNDAGTPWIYVIKDASTGQWYFAARNSRVDVNLKQGYTGVILYDYSLTPVATRVSELEVAFDYSTYTTLSSIMYYHTYKPLMLDMEDGTYQDGLCFVLSLPDLLYTYRRLSISVNNGIISITDSDYFTSNSYLENHLYGSNVTITKVDQKYFIYIHYINVILPRLVYLNNTIPDIMNLGSFMYTKILPEDNSQIGKYVQYTKPYSTPTETKCIVSGYSKKFGLTSNVITTTLDTNPTNVQITNIQTVNNIEPVRMTHVLPNTFVSSNNVTLNKFNSDTALQNDVPDETITYNFTDNDIANLFGYPPDYELLTWTLTHTGTHILIYAGYRRGTILHYEVGYFQYTLTGTEITNLTKLSSAILFHTDTRDTADLHWESYHNLVILNDDFTYVTGYALLRKTPGSNSLLFHAIRIDPNTNVITVDYSDFQLASWHYVGVGFLSSYGIVLSRHFENQFKLVYLTYDGQPVNTDDIARFKTSYANFQTIVQGTNQLGYIARIVGNIGFKVFTTGFKALLSKYHNQGPTEIDLTLYDPAPQNKKFFVYLKEEGDSIGFEVTQSYKKTSKNSYFIGYCTTNNIGIDTSYFHKRVYINNIPIERITNEPTNINEMYNMLGDYYELDVNEEGVFYMSSNLSRYDIPIKMTPNALYEAVLVIDSYASSDINISIEPNGTLYTGQFTKHYIGADYVSGYVGPTEDVFTADAFGIDALSGSIDLAPAVFHLLIDNKATARKTITVRSGSKETVSITSTVWDTNLDVWNWFGSISIAPNLATFTGYLRIKRIR